jgi:hypothetical protein
MKSRRERVVQVASIESVKEWGEGGIKRNGRFG